MRCLLEEEQVTRNEWKLIQRVIEVSESKDWQIERILEPPEAYKISFKKHSCGEYLDVEIQEGMVF